MAKKDFDPTNSSSGESHSFDGNMQRDTRDFHLKESQWTYARNAVNNSNIGDIGKLGNEPANRLCIKVWQNPDPLDPLNGTGPLTIIGFVHLEKDKWIVYSTDDTNSEVGYFEEEICRYTRIVNDPCLNFKTTNLIYGQSRKDFQCKYSVYWADGLNPDRYLPIGNIDFAPYAAPWPDVPWVCNLQPPTPDPNCNVTIDPNNPPPCEICVPKIPLQLDCDRARLESLMQPICIQLSKGAFGGELLNGSYFALAAYTVNGQRVTDYCTPSNVQPLFDHSGVGGALDVNIYCIDYENFDEFELVIVSVNQQQAVAKRIGIYDTKKLNAVFDTIYIPIDIIDKSLQTIPLNQLPIRNTIFDKSEALYRVNDYLLRVAPTSKFMFNYQPLANQIRVKWQSVEYSEDYYINGGNNTGYMRDEVYSFFIRWVYETGDKSASFHIPGRPPFRPLGGAASLEADSNGDIIYYSSAGAPPVNEDVIEIGLGFAANQIPVWQVINTAISLGAPTTDNVLCDGGVVVDEGYMGYWESTEKYPDNKPEIWNASAHDWSCINANWPYLNTGANSYDLCGRPIRHHRFPDNDLNQNVSHFRDKAQTPNPLSQPADRHIRIMGVKFENIRPPVDNYGNPIPNIVGYEILRGSRTGNRSVISKGIINNMFGYNLAATGNITQVGLYQNYPFNDLHADPFISKTKTRNGGLTGTIRGDKENDDVKSDFFSYHSPDTTFSNPFLGAIELKLYQDIAGTANMRQQYPNGHPQHVVFRNVAVIFALIAGIATALVATRGETKSKRSEGPRFTNNLGSQFIGVSSTLTANPFAYVGAALSLLSSFGQSTAKGVTNALGWNLAAAILGVGYNKYATEAFPPLDAVALPQTIAVLTSYLQAVTGGESQNWESERSSGAYDSIPLALNTLGGVLGISGGVFNPTFVYYLSEGTQVAWRAMNAFAKPRQHALQIMGHCLYDEWTSRQSGERRRLIGKQGYIDNQFHNFGEDYLINNLYRNKYVALQLSVYAGGGTLVNTLAPPAIATDDTRVNSTLEQLYSDYGVEIYRNPERGFQRTSSTYYTSLKQRLRNQYGQLSSILQLPISCVIKVCPPSTLGGNRIKPAAAEGFGLRLLQGASSCPNNVIMDPDFPTNNSIGPLPSPWQSDEQGYWLQNIVGASTAAGNNGIVLVQTQPGETFNLILGQVFFDPVNSVNISCIYAQNYALSFDILNWPTNTPNEYKLKIYLGPVAPLNQIGTVINTNPPNIPAGTVSVTLGMLPYSWNSATDAVTLVIPGSTNVTELNFVLEGPDVPHTVTADIVGSGQFPNSTVCPGGCAYDFKIYTPRYTNIQNDINNSVLGSQELFTLVSSGGTISSYYSLIDNKSFITNLKCDTRFFYRIQFQAKWDDVPFTPGAQAQTYMNVGLYRLTPGCCAGLAWINTPLAWITNQPYTSFTPNFQTFSFTGTILINDPLPTDRYALVFSWSNLYLVVDGLEISFDTCWRYEDVAISNVCLECTTENVINGCMDDMAANYDPAATNNTGCVYLGCCDPGATNYMDQAANPPVGSFGICCDNGPQIINGVTYDPADFPNLCPCTTVNGGGGSGPSPGVGNNGPCWPDCYPAQTNPVRYSSYTMFGGDIYINRYTEKNSFFYFYDWLYKQPDETEFDYLKYKMIPWPMYWHDSQGFNIDDFVSSMFNFVTNPVSWFTQGFDDIPWPSEFYVFDKPGNVSLFTGVQLNLGFIIKFGYFWLFQSGVRDFFVESEYNVDLRDYNDLPEQRHYQSKGRDSYTDLSTLFDTSIIKFGNYYKYDTSLSISKIYFGYTSWGNMYPSYYNPYVAETCYQYRPNRILYSMPVQIEGVRDGWRIFLSNNYKEFISKVTCVKQINKSGAMILFESDSPVMFQGTDQLQTDLGTKLTIGDGGLFSQPMQSLMNADRPYEFGSCQNKLSVVNTPAGVFWISQNQGKIFSMMSGLTEISMSNIKWWLAQFLPYQLTKFYPNYKLTDNPVAGIGCQTTYDNTNNVVYFSKKDYKPVLDDGVPIANYDEDGNFFWVGNINNEVQLTDPRYFDKASWTLSYDVKVKAFISYHDWHPDLNAPGNDTFATTKGNGVWMHNDRCDLFTNYYGVNHPFEVEYVTDTLMTVNTLRSVEYQLEVYKYKYENCYDRFHVLDFNFDEAVIYNTEQCSGKLRLNLTPKNNAPLILQYPIINPASIDILYSKEENKYRFNQFWDITRDRGEFDWQINNNQAPPVPGDLSYPPVPTNAPLGGSAPGTFRQQTIWNTEPNGYVRTLNNFNLNYSVNDKPLQHKKFRHYNTSVLLRRRISGNRKMLVSITTNKNLLSPR